MDGDISQQKILEILEESNKVKDMGKEFLVRLENQKNTLHVGMESLNSMDSNLNNALDAIKELQKGQDDFNNTLDFMDSTMNEVLDNLKELQKGQDAINVLLKSRY